VCRSIIVHPKASQWGAEKRPAAAFPSSFVVAAYIQERLTPQDCLPDRQVKSAAGALYWAFLISLKAVIFFKRFLKDKETTHLPHHFLG
jgi:hypothetical protein